MTQVTVHEEQEIWNLLRCVRLSSTGEDLVAAGVIRSIQSEPTRIVVGVDPSRCPEGTAPLERRIRLALSCLHREVGIVSEDGALRRADAAPGAGYEPEGPDPLAGPARGLQGPAPAVPVFQWEVAPDDPEAPSSEAYLERDGWEYNVWWQLHPQELVYASIQALQEDFRPSSRRHPVGRSVVVNLVYDPRRGGVVAIYGTARDFRPFVDAFWQAFHEARPEEEPHA